MLRKHILFLFFILFSFLGNASHILGGEITWTCQGGDYVFQMVFYRDCNEADFNAPTVTMKVWGHPTVNSVTLNLQSRTDISPTCTVVAGGPPQLDCGTGPNGGNGLGAIEKTIYTSAPITLSGTPPSGGWVFTYETSTRSTSVTNLVTATTPAKGITLVSKIFATPSSINTCVDNSPQFLQEPYFISCAGSPYNYHMNAIDPDLDSISVSFGIPLDDLNGGTYVDGVAPAPILFEPGFSVNSPTPDATMSPGSVPATIDPQTGNISFLSNTTGLYNIKVVAQSFKQGVLSAEISREMLLMVTNCNGTNNAPAITGPFGGLFETTVTAGSLVNFNLASTDVELLQDGSPQNNILSATGPMFGTNFTSSSGCAIAPCATLNTTPLITMSQGVNTTFDWQTDCNHLVRPDGSIATSVPYHFVFKIQDDYCPIPKVSYATITINVTNPGIVDAPIIDCIQTDAAGNVTLNWNQVNDPLGTFNSYQVHSVQDGLIATIPSINTTTYVDASVGTQKDYFLVTASACNGNTLRYSDTLSNIFLTLNNPGNGTALLQWNDPVTPALPSMNAYYHIYREYPAGTWTLYDSVPYGSHFYKDTITICSVFLNYQIVLPNQPCDYTSNVAGDNFTDQIAPDIPILNVVTIDTLTGDVTITWNQNNHPDTYGYIIYVENSVGAIVQLNQQFGIGNTSYTYSPDITQGPLTYSVAAFDSCFTTSVPPTYHTSAKGELHTTVFLTSSLNICTKEVTLSWTDYIGWNNLDHYEIYGKTTTSGWVNYGSVNGNNFTVITNPGENYTFVVQAVAADGRQSFSNPSIQFIAAPRSPSFNYLKVATVVGNEVQLRHYIDASANISEVIIQRKNGSVFEEIARLPVTSNNLVYNDEDVDVNSNSYTYRVQYVDSCGLPGGTSNEAKTILLNIDYDAVRKLNYLNWNPYHQFFGSILNYNLYRGFDSIITGGAIANLPDGEYSFVDDVYNVVSKGKICYYVEAIESMNVYSFSEISRSNIRCMTLPPIIYIPNAFTPDGINPVFKPVLSDFDPSDYDFTIFDRWGQVVFKTNVPEEGWDGKIQLSHKMAQTGTYVYMVVLHDGDGVEVVRRGHVSLLK